jgi:Tol biopolymer transport system component
MTHVRWLSVTAAIGLLVSGGATSTASAPVEAGLYAVTANGRIHPVIENRDFMGMSAMSPDRRRIAFVQGVTLEGIWIVDLTGAPPRLVAGGAKPKYSPAWSPNGRQVAFGVCEEHQCRPDTDVVAAAGNRIVTALPGTLSFSWSADGSLLAGAGGLGRDSKTPTHVVVGNPSGSSHHALVLSEAFPPAPAFAPRGDLIAFVCGYQRVCVIHAHGGKKQLLRGSASSPDIPRFAWAPDGEHLAVAVDHGGTSEVALDDLRTGMSRPLGAISSGVNTLTFARRGGGLVAAGPAGIAIISPGGQITKLVAPQGFVDSDPVWSPDGAQLAFTSNSLASPAQRIEVVRRDASHPHMLTNTQTGTATIVGFARTGQLIYEIR